MVHEDERVVRIHARVLGRRPEEVLGVGHHELVQRRARRHQDGRRPAAATAGAAGLLPERRDPAGIASQHRDVQVADVDAELERVGRDDAEHLALAQALLDRPAPGGQVAAAIAAHDPAVARLVGDAALDRRQQDLGGEAALREDDRRDLRPEESQRELRGLAEIGRADAELGVDDRRVVADEHLVAGRRPALGDLLDRLADEAARQLARVRDRRRRHDELRRRAIVPADPAQPSQHVGQMRAEDAAIGVQLVDHDVAQVLEERRPLRVVRKDPGVEHVGVRQDEVRARAHRAPRVLRRVAVVGEHPHLGQLPGERLQLGQLILGERLRRKEVEDARVRLMHERLERRQVVAERLARRGRRDDDDVLPLRDQIPRARLVRIELVDTPRAERVADAWVERGGERSQDWRARRKVPGRRNARPRRR